MSFATMDEALENIQKDMFRLKQYFPYRIVWGAVNPDTLQTETGANCTNRQANDMIRKGWHVYVQGNLSDKQRESIK